MGSPFIIIQHLRSVGEELTEVGYLSGANNSVISLTTRHGLEAKTNTLQLELLNCWQKYAETVQVNDTLRVWLDWNPVAYTSGNWDKTKFLMEAEIQDISSSGSETAKKITLKGVDKTIRLMFSLWGFNYGQKIDANNPPSWYLPLDNVTGPTAPKVIRDIIRQVSIKQTAQFFISAALTNEKAGVLTGLDTVPSTPISMTIKIKPGTWELNGSQFSSSSITNIVVSSAEANPRFDIVVANSSGSIYLIKGTAATTPSIPSTPSNSTRLNVIYVPTGTVSIDVKKIHDMRVFGTEDGQIEFERPTSNSADKKFPVINPSFTFKNVYDWLDFLSQIDSTNTPTELTNGLIAKKPYYFFIDSGDVFSWYYPYPEDSPDKIEEGDRIYSWKLAKDSRDVVNMIIYNAGKDPDLHGTTSYAINTRSEDSRLRMKYIAWDKISEDMKSDERANKYNAFPWNDPDNDGYPEPNGNPLSAGNPWIPAWNTSLSITSNAIYKSEFRKYAKEKGKAIADKVFSSYGQGIYKLTVEMRGNRSFAQGQVIEGIIHSERWGQLYGRRLKLRVSDIVQKITRSGWFTTIEAEEDIPELTKLGGI